MSSAFAIIPCPPTPSNVLVDAILPPPVKPAPAVIFTPLCATCSSATKSLKSSCLYKEYNSAESILMIPLPLTLSPIPDPPVI